MRLPERLAPTALVVFRRLTLALRARSWVYDPSFFGLVEEKARFRYGDQHDQCMLFLVLQKQRTTDARGADSGVLTSFESMTIQQRLPDRQIGMLAYGI